MKFYAEITGFTEDSLYFLNPENNFILIFNEDCPPELAEISILHTISEVYEDPAPGDKMVIGKKEYTISAVGYEVLKTLKEMGHCTVCFNGGDEAERPGMMMLEGEPFLPEDVYVGGVIKIYDPKEEK